jgi:aryl-alcohol dehydrogenase-like predicted oxidoreductase
MQTLVLGTANFGENYGIANKSGLSNEEVEEILNWSTGKISELDTSLDYKESHQVISKHSSKFKISSKINLDQVTSPKDIPKKVKIIIDELCTNSVERILLRPHSTDRQFTIDSLGEIEKLRSLGFVAETGLSIYETNELDFFVDSIESPILFQVPLNLFNRAFQEKLNSNNKRYENFKFYVRSIFLQGLLLLDPRDIPNHLKEAIVPVSALNQELSRIETSIIEATFAFIGEQKWVNGVIIGINSLQNLLSNYEYFNKRKRVDLTFLQNIPTVPSRILDPRKW